MMKSCRVYKGVLENSKSIEVFQWIFQDHIFFVPQAHLKVLSCDIIKYFINSCKFTNGAYTTHFSSYLIRYRFYTIDAQ